MKNKMRFSKMIYKRLPMPTLKLYAFSLKLMLTLCILLIFHTVKAQLDVNGEKYSDPPSEVLMVGTFHFHNPGADVAKTKSFDILAPKAQEELEDICDAIISYAPSKIFVEWDYKEVAELDSLYQSYLDDQYFKKDSLSDFYRKNEIFQLAFRAAKKLGHTKVWAMDYRETEFPFDSLMKVMAKNDQQALQKKFADAIERFTTDFDQMIDSGTSLKDMLYHLNSKGLRRLSNDLQTIWPLTAGDRKNFTGPYLVSEWYRRNLYMWSLIQKQCAETDRRIMVLAGASHAAMIEEFIHNDDQWKIVELKTIME